MLSGEISYQEVKDRTSSAVGSTTDDGGLFDETIAAYALRRKAALDFMEAALVDSHNKAFRAYLSRTHWTPASEDNTIGPCRGEIRRVMRGCANVLVDPSQLTITAQLDEPLRVSCASFLLSLLLWFPYIDMFFRSSSATLTFFSGL